MGCDTDDEDFDLEWVQTNKPTAPAITNGDGDNPLGSVFDLYWGIHLHSIEGAGPITEEMESMKAETLRVFDDTYGGKRGIPNTFVACTLRRRTREQWKA